MGCWCCCAPWLYSLLLPPASDTTPLGMPLTAHIAHTACRNAYTACHNALSPEQVDPSVSFDMVGGLDHYIKVGTVGGRRQDKMNVMAGWMGGWVLGGGCRGLKGLGVCDGKEGQEEEDEGLGPFQRHAHVRTPTPTCRPSRR